MNNITSLFPPNYKNLEQREAIALLEKIEKAVEDLDKGCECCDFSSGDVGETMNTMGDDFVMIYNQEDKSIALATDDMHFKTLKINFCPKCGRDLRKEEL